MCFLVCCSFVCLFYCARAFLSHVLFRRWFVVVFVCLLTCMFVCVFDRLFVWLMSCSFVRLFGLFVCLISILSGCLTVCFVNGFVA